MMAQCWALQMPGVAKAVLISLADNANDAGFCWPSIETICDRTCFKRRAVIDAIKWLEDNGHLSANRSNGRHTTYTLHPNQCAKRTSAADAPVRQTHDTSAPDARDQCAKRTLTVKEPSKNRQEGKEARATKRCPDDFEVTDDLQAWVATECPGLDFRRATDEFRDHTFATARADWPATWRNWMRRAHQSHRNMPPARAAPPPRRSAAIESGLALAGLSRKASAEVIDVQARTVARCLG